MRKRIVVEFDAYPLGSVLLTSKGMPPTGIGYALYNFSKVEIYLTRPSNTVFIESASRSAKIHFANKAQHTAQSAKGN